MSSIGLTDSLFILKEENSEKHLSVDSVSGTPTVEKPASTSGLDFQPAALEVSQTEEGKTEQKETLSQTSDDRSCGERAKGVGDKSPGAGARNSPMHSPASTASSSLRRVPPRQPQAHLGEHSLWNGSSRGGKSLNPW